MPITPKKRKGAKRSAKSAKVTASNKKKGAFEKKTMQKGGGDFGKIKPKSKSKRPTKKYVEKRDVGAKSSATPGRKAEPGKMAVKRKTTTVKQGGTTTKVGKSTAGKTGSQGSARSRGSIDKIKKGETAITSRKRSATGEKNKRVRDKSPGSGAVKPGASKSAIKSRKKAKKTARKGYR
jgi:hypothetical protein